MRFLCFLVLTVAAHAEVYSLSLQETVARGLSQNPDVVLARYAEQRAQQEVGVANDPFSLRVFAGSGLAYSNGYPMSIDGSAPSVVQGRAYYTLFNRPRQLLVSEVREHARGAGIDVAIRREEAAFRVASVYLDLVQVARVSELLGGQIASLERSLALVEARVAEGQELPIEQTRAAVNLAKAKQRSLALTADQAYLASSLAVLLGYTADDRIAASDPQAAAIPLPGTEGEAVAAALRNNNQIKRLESSLMARQFAVRAAGSARLPQVDLVAQYGLFAKFNNYDQFFQRFQRHNGQIGASIALPLLTGSAPRAQMAQAQTDILRIRAELNSVRERTAVDTRRAYQQMQTAQSAQELARMDLDLANADQQVLDAQIEEGRAPVSRLEAAKAVATEKAISLFETQQSVLRARLALLRQLGQLAEFAR